MKDLLLKRGISSIWHFTDESNLKSIEKNGILSYCEAQKRNIHIPAPGGNEVSHNADRKNSVDDYIHACFSKKHPMLYVAKEDGRIKKPILLKISIDVLDIDGVMYTNDVSNKSGVQKLSSIDAVRQINIEDIFDYLDFDQQGMKERKNSALKSEILIPKFIPVKMIIGKEYG